MKPIFVFAPGSGEPFECSPLNARDLVEHAGWSYSAPEAPTAAAPEAPVEPPVVTKPARSRPAPATKPEVKIEEAVVETPQVEETPVVETKVEETPVVETKVEETSNDADAE